MKKAIILITVLAASISFGATGSIAATATTATFTNSGPHSLVYIENAAVVMATATNDTFSVLVTKDSVDYQVATITVTTNSVYGNVVVTNPIPVGNDGVYKITRTVTNFAATVYIDVR